MVKEVKNPRKKIPIPTQCLLWARAAGRCEFEGCNRPLWKSLVTQETVNAGQKAHVYAYSAGGARGHRGVVESVIDSVDNLMLVCPVCHLKIDKEQDGGHYTAELLQRWKQLHEKRIETVTGIAPSKGSHVVHYTANIDVTNVNLSFQTTAEALFPLRYPADDKPIELGRSDAAVSDRDAAFWAAEDENLRLRVERRIGDRVASKEVSHLSIFALAPQPLLIRLGTLLPEVIGADVYAHHKEPKGWLWQEGGPPADYQVTVPQRPTGLPALVLALSSDLAPERIHSVLGPDAALWVVTIPAPHNDFLKTRVQLQAFRQCLRPLLDQIKQVHGQQTPLSIFPAMPAAMAVELGRVRSPKASMPWAIYDQVNNRGGFVPALTIDGETPR